MGALVTRRARTRQPAGAALIDRANPLGARVIECLPLNGQPYATVSGNKLTLANGVINAAKDRALALRGNGSACASVPLDLSKYSKVTIAFWLYWDAYANNDALAMEFGASYLNQGFIVDPNSAGSWAGQFMFGVGSNTSGSASNLPSIARPSAGAWHRICLTFDRTTGLFASSGAWVDGVRQAVNTPATLQAVAGNFANDTLHLFSRNEASLFGAGSMEMLTIYDGILSAGEAAEDFQNCYQVLKAPARRLWLAYSSGTSNTGTIATTLAGAALSASGQVVNVGTLASTLSGATLAANGLVASPPSGALASALSGASMAAAGSVTNAGALASTLAGANLSAAGTVTNRGAIASQLDGAGLAASGNVIIIPAGAMVSTLDGAALAAGGYVGTPPARPDFFIRLPKNPRHVIHHH